MEDHVRLSCSLDFLEFYTLISHCYEQYVFKCSRQSVILTLYKISYFLVVE